MDIKATLNMPKTDFEMRGNLPSKEPKWVEKWESEHLYEKMLAKNQGHTPFILHDGPPYANGNMHCGHMLNHLLKDFIIRYKTMQGFYTPFIPGWDTHGLPIENVITKKGISRKTTPIREFRQHCETFAKSQVALQMSQVKRIGVLGDFAHPYLTLDPEFEAAQIRVFRDMALKGYIYKGKKPVYWSPSSESALAEAEIEYADVESHAIYVAFPVSDGKGVLDHDVSFIIWTTTPWTIPANLAICVHPQFTYGVYRTDRGRFIFLKDLESQVIEEIGFTSCHLEKEISGRELEGILAKHPFYDRTSLVILGEHVTNETGTGCVHTAPGHGEDDFRVGTLYQLPPLCPVDSKGYMTAEAGSDLEGLFYEDANAKVLEKLLASGHLLKSTKIIHSYPHDWRTHKPLIFRATPQWFCSIEPIRKQLLKEIDRVKWKPSWGKQRIHNMIRDRGDWCISRQRAWGVPIPIIIEEDGTPIMSAEVFDHISDLFAQYGSHIWFEKEAVDLLPPGYTSPRSPHRAYQKETDIMDVWFDSGSSSIAVLKQRGLPFPADLYLEGSDQYRGWFNSSLIIATAVLGQSPYHQVVSHGFIQDSEGEKMSKSKGNGVDPMKMAATYGADILRLWSASVDYQADVKFGEDMVKRVSENYRKIRNTCKFMLGNLFDFDRQKDQASHFSEPHKWLLAQLEQVKNQVIQSYDTYDFASVVATLMNFMSSDLSSFYLDMTKDILYCDAANSPRRKEVQTVIDRILDTLVRLWTPILPFTMEEVYAHDPNHQLEAAQLLDFPPLSAEYEATILERYRLFHELRSEVLKALEEARANGLIGSSQEAHVTLPNKDTYRDLYEHLSADQLTSLLVVSNVNIGSDDLVTVKVHDGKRCERCWNYFSELESSDEVLLCHRCHQAMEENHD